MSEHGSNSAHHHAAHEKETKSPEKHKKHVETESPEREHAAERARADGREAGFPVGKLLIMLLLIAVILAAGYAGILFYEQYTVIKAEHDAVIDAANAELDAAMAEYDVANPDSEAHIAERKAVSEEILREAKNEMSRMEQDMGALDQTIADAESRIREMESQEEFKYYMSIYDQYEQGRDYVEELLSDD